MHVPTGEIIELTEEKADFFEEIEKRSQNDEEHEKRLVDRMEKLVALTKNESEQLEPLDKKQRKGWMRNQPCVCGSGKKFKKCCWGDFK